MLQHTAKIAIPEHPLGNADAEFTIHRNKKQYGKLLISKGAVVWRSGRKQRGLTITWGKFNKMMAENGQEEKKLKKKTSTK